MHYFYLSWVTTKICYRITGGRRDGACRHRIMAVSRDAKPTSRIPAGCGYCHFVGTHVQLVPPLWFYLFKTCSWLQVFYFLVYAKSTIPPARRAVGVHKQTCAQLCTNVLIGRQLSTSFFWDMRQGIHVLMEWAMIAQVISPSILGIISCNSSITNLLVSNLRHRHKVKPRTKVFRTSPTRVLSIRLAWGAEHFPSHDMIAAFNRAMS